MELFFREYGDGQPIVILHGLLGLSDNWVGIARKLATEGFKVFIPDQRNHGQSPRNPVFNYYALTDDIAEFIERNNLADPIILGHSMGGKVAMRFTLENPHKVSKLIVVDTSLRTYINFNYHMKLIEAMLSVDLSSIHSRKEVEVILSQKINDDRMVQFLMKNLYRKEKELLAWKPALEIIREHIEDLYGGIFYSSIYENPALFIRGGKSDYVLEEDYQAIYRSFPAAVIKTVENAAHWVHADEPTVFYRMLLEFLKS